MGARAAADRDRLADVQHPAGVVAEQVHARVLAAARRSRAGAAASPPGCGACGPVARSARRRVREQRERVGDRQRRSRTAAGTARTARARTSRRRRARGARSRTSIPSASASTPSPRLFCSGSSLRASAAVQRTGGSASRARSARTPGAARGGRTARCAPPAPGPRSSSSSGGRTSSSAGAPSSISCVIPVNRWIPRRSGALRAHERGPAVVQLATADQHRAHLGHLARIAAEAVGLGVDDEKLGARDRLLEQRPRRA